MNYKNVPVMVLGANGFIGRWVARALSRQGAILILPVIDPSDAKSVFRNYGIQGEIYPLDLANFDRVGDLLNETRPTILFNLAGYGVSRNERDESQAYRINAELLGVLCQPGWKRDDPGWTGQQIIHVGSAMEYGANTGDLSEDSATVPTTIYGRSKLAGTKLLSKSSVETGVHALTARLFAVYGPGEPRNRLLPSLIQAAETGESLELTAGLHQRDFVNVEDVADGLLRLGMTAAPLGSVVNIATGKLTTIKEFAETAAEILGMDRDRLKFGALPTREEEMAHKPVSIRKLVELSGWVPQTDIASGIQKTLEFYRAQLSGVRNG